MDGDICYSPVTHSPDGTRLELSTAKDGRRWQCHCPPHQYKEVSGSGAQCVPSLGHGKMYLKPAEH